jgi:hypothetical protein
MRRLLMFEVSLFLALIVMSTASGGMSTRASPLESPPFRATPIGGPPPPASAITPVLGEAVKRESGVERSGVAIEPTATPSAMLARVRVRPRVSVSVVERRQWETWRRHNVD